MSNKSRQLKEAVDNGTLPENTSYCRKCMLIRQVQKFSKTTTPDIDSTGLLSVCKDCIEKMYEVILLSEGGSIQKTILRLCKMFNVLYYEPAIDSALAHIATRGSSTNKVFPLYTAKLLVSLRANMTDANVDLTYKDNPVINFNNTVPEEFEVEHDVVKYWGKGYDKEQYAWLESQLGQWRKTHKNDTMAEETLLREIVFKQFEIEKTRNDTTSKKGTANLIKELQDLMKTASVDPAKSNKASAGKSQDTFSSFIKLIEETEPADYYEDKELFKDYDNIGKKYFEPYVTRPLKNFITMSRDFNIENESEGEDNEFDIFTENNLDEELPSDEITPNESEAKDA